MSNEQMIRIPSTLAESAFDAFASVGMHEQLDALNAILEQPAEQHQGEPVALPERKAITAYGLTALDSEAEGWNACLDEIAKLGPLYTHADPGEVERLRAELAEWKKRCQYNADTAHDVARERDTLRAQLAERDALLRDLEGKTVLSWHDKRRISAALSASAERIEECAHSYANSLGCPECGEAFGVARESAK